MSAPFEVYCRWKTGIAANAQIAGFTSVIAPPGPVAGLVAVGNSWSCERFDGVFYRTPRPAPADRPAVGLVFVQSADGNTVAPDPETLGGGLTDKHLVYEGLSRVDADGVLAGAATAAEDNLVFSIWHPELVRLRAERGRPRHPVQIILTNRGDLPVDRALLYNEPLLRVVVVASTPGAAVLARRLVGRPWVEVIDAGAPVALRRAFAELRRRGIESVSAVGGLRTARALLRARLVDELYLTTSPRTGGEPNTPLWEGSRPPHRIVLEKRGRGEDAGVRFEHLIFEP